MSDLRKREQAVVRAAMRVVKHMAEGECLDLPTYATRLQRFGRGYQAALVRACERLRKAQS